MQQLPAVEEHPRLAAAELAVAGDLRRTHPAQNRSESLLQTTHRRTLGAAAGARPELARNHQAAETGRCQVEGREMPHLVAAPRALRSWQEVLPGRAREEPWRGPSVGPFHRLTRRSFRPEDLRLPADALEQPLRVGALGESAREARHQMPETWVQGRVSGQVEPTQVAGVSMGNWLHQQGRQEALPRLERVGPRRSWLPSSTVSGRLRRVLASSLQRPAVSLHRDRLRGTAEARDGAPAHRAAAR